MVIPGSFKSCPNATKSNHIKYSELGCAFLLFPTYSTRWSHFSLAVHSWQLGLSSFGIPFSCLSDNCLSLEVILLKSWFINKSKTTTACSFPLVSIHKRPLDVYLNIHPRWKCYLRWTLDIELGCGEPWQRIFHTLVQFRRQGLCLFAASRGQSCWLIF